MNQTYQDITMELMSIQNEIAFSLVGDVGLEELIRRYMETCLRRLSLRSVHIFLFMDNMSEVFAGGANGPANSRSFAIPQKLSIQPFDIPDIERLIHQWLNDQFHDAEITTVETEQSCYHLFPMDHGGVLILERMDQPLPNSVVQAFAPIVDYLQNFCEAAIQHQRVLHEVDRRTRAERRLQHVAYHDELTGLPNRLHIIGQLEEALAAARKNDHVGALVYIDVDNFRDINDSLGHSVGDLLLKLLGQRLSHDLPEDVICAHMGGDEFALLLSNLSSDSTNFSENGTDLSDDAIRLSDDSVNRLTSIVNKLKDKLKYPFHTQERSLYIEASFGLTYFNGEEADALTVLRQGDMAMSQVKSSGRNGIQFFAASMEKEARRRFHLDADMRQALINDDFELYLQPQVHNNGCIFGAECLIRWRHPELGFVSPLDFIAIAEQTGFIVPMGEWILRKACHYICKLREKPQSRFWRLAVNISAKQFHQPDFVDRVTAILNEYGVPGCSLELELTESTLIDNVEQAIEKMLQLRAMGIQMSIDDFGTGYSSLMYLKQLPVHRIKVDQSFVRNIHQSPDDATIVEATMAMAGRFGLNVIAEGVETEEELQFLANMGCNEFQGYYFHKPMKFQHLLDIISLTNPISS